MKKYIFYCKALGLLSILLIVGCSQNEMTEYENDPALYFHNAAYEQQDSITHSFFVLSPTIVRDTVYVKVNTMGTLSNQDRPILIEQTNVGEPDAAIAGVHYIAFDSEEMKKYMKIPANAATTSFPVIFIHDKSLDLMQVRLHLKIGKNDYFRPGIDKWRVFVLTTTAQAVKPRIWDTVWKNTFGATWGTVKMRFIIDVTGYTEWDVNPAMAYANYMKGKVEQALEDYNLAHPLAPLAEADGTLVTFK